MDPTPKPYLKHKKTGEIYPYAAVLAKRDDMEPTDDAPQLVQPISPPLKARAAPAAVVVNNGPSAEHVSRAVDAAVDAAVQPLVLRIAALEKQVAGMAAREPADQPTGLFTGQPAMPTAAPATAGRRRRAAPTAPASQAEVSPPLQVSMPGFEHLMQHAQAAAGAK